MNDHPSKNMPAENTPADNAASLNEQLVAYLDGELDAESARRIEAQLASNANVRRRLQSLERTWELLDDLDAAPVGEPFTRTTLEMVALAAGDDLAQSRIEAPRRRRRRRLQILGVLAAAAAVGFLGVWLFTPDTNRRLIDNLPVLEQFEEYRETGTIGFLRQLRNENLFPPKTPSPSGVVAAKPEDAIPEDTAARRLLIERMTPDAKAELARVEDRFDHLAPEDRQALRQLHNDLQKASDREELRGSMHEYYEWSKTLTSYSGESLSKMSSGERLQWVKEQRKLEQSHAAVPRLVGPDPAKFATWYRAFIARHKDDFQKSLTPAEQRKFSESDEERRSMIETRMVRAINSHELLPIMTDGDLSQLRGQLSDAARKQMEDSPSLGQWHMVLRWLHPRESHDFRLRRSFADGPHRLLPSDIELNERLADFFEALAPEQRGALLSMPSDEMYQRLWFLYQQSRPKPPEGPPRHPDGPWREHRHPGDAAQSASKEKMP